MPDWSKLSSYHDKKWKSFEELCYQVPHRLYSSKGTLSRIDDSGGGDGVEFYLTFPNGTEWGWQAKYYPPGSRLSEKNRKTHIAESFKRSLRNHPKLKKWFLCTPMTFTTAEDKWFKSKLKVKGRRVALKHWHGSEIDALLNLPAMAGIKQNFFGTLEFTPEWFTKQVSAQLRSVRDKYNPLLHVESEGDLRAHALLGDKKCIVYFDRLLNQSKEYFVDFEHALEEARSHSIPKQWKSKYNRLLELHNQFHEKIQAGYRVFINLSRLTKEGRFQDVSSTELSALIQNIDDIARQHDEQRRQFAKDASKSKLPLPEDKREEIRKEPLDLALEKAYTPFTSGADLVDVLRQAQFYLEIVASHYLHFLGTAGVGKTHLSCNLCSDRVEQGLPAIFLLGNSFSPGTETKHKIMDICGVPRTYSFEEFLSALDSYAFSRRTKVLIAIDGLNESMNPTLWKTQLPALEYALEGCQRVVLVTSCRSSYLPAIWGDNRPSRSAVLVGFTSQSAEEAVEKYFHYYKLRATLTLASLTQFENPLYLKIYCESQNPDRIQEKEVHIGEQTFLDILDEFLNQVNKRISDRLSKPRSAQLVQKGLTRLARHLWEKNERFVKFDETVRLLDLKEVTEIDWDNSFTKLLQDEGLLITRIWARESNEEFVSFTYDFFGGYMISRACLEQTDTTRAKVFLKSKQFKERLLGQDFSQLHRLHEDILRCMAVLLPAKAGIYLHSGRNQGKAFSIGIRALFEMGPNYIRVADKSILRRLFRIPANQKALLECARGTAFNTNHPLNWEFWDSLLSSMSVAERDESWTEYVRGHSGDFLALAQKLERECNAKSTFSQVEYRRMQLAARFFQWVLTSTHRLLRDTATKTLYSYGRHFPEELFSLTLNSLNLNDPYVPERMLAASYGVAMALHKVEERSKFGRRILPGYARALYMAMFAKGAKHATTHTLMRDYAKHTIDLAVMHHADLLNPKQLGRIEPPSSDGGIRRLRKGKDRNPKQYRDGNFPLGTDFHNYTLGRLVKDRRNYDFKQPLFKRVVSHVWWRIYNLGYTLDRFGEIDKAIVRSRWRISRNEENTSRVDRYGKKYAWIAFYELYGLFQDKGLLDAKWPAYDPRPSDVDIEPSFPLPPHSLKIVNESFLEPERMPPRQWIRKGPVPDVRPYLIVEELDGEHGPWVMLDGFVLQEREEIGHRISISVMALLVQSSIVQKVAKLARNSISEGYWLPRAPESYYSFVGEIPWCESIPFNGREEIEFVTEIRKEKESLEDVERRLANRRLLREFRRVYGLNDRDTGSSEQSTPRMKEVVVKETVAVTIPTRLMAWESYHTGLSRSPGHVVAKDIAASLRLWVRLPSIDLYDEAGKRAAIAIEWGDSWTNRQTAVYLRRDLFDKFLHANGLGCVWGVWGERDYSSNLIESLPLTEDRNIRWMQFKDAYVYKDRRVITPRSKLSVRRRSRRTR